MRRSPRVAFFTDSYEEANGIARLTHELELYAARRDLPFLCVHASTLTSLGPPGLRLRLRLGRSAAAFPLEHDLRFDPLLWRHVRLVRRVVCEFQPDILHVTGPSDVGQLGAYLGHRLSIPMVGSWHTNLHQYAALRSQKWLRWLPKSLRIAVQGGMERQVPACGGALLSCPAGGAGAQRGSRPPPIGAATQTDLPDAARRRHGDVFA